MVRSADSTTDPAENPGCRYSISGLQGRDAFGDAVCGELGDTAVATLGLMTPQQRNGIVQAESAFQRQEGTSVGQAIASACTVDEQVIRVQAQGVRLSQPLPVGEVGYVFKLGLAGVMERCGPGDHV